MFQYYISVQFSLLQLNYNLKLYFVTLLAYVPENSADVK